MREGTSVEKHLKDMKELTDRLAAMGAPIAEEDQVVTLLGSLLKSYSTLVTILEARSGDISLNYVQQALLPEEQKLNGQNHSSDPDTLRGDSALVGDSNKRFNPCKPLTCFGCGQAGHIKRDCPKNKKGKSRKAKTADEKSYGDNDIAYAAWKDCSQNSLWLVDSSASSHMTWNKKNVIELPGV